MEVSTVESFSVKEVSISSRAMLSTFLLLLCPPMGKKSDLQALQVGIFEWASVEMCGALLGTETATELEDLCFVTVPAPVMWPDPIPHFLSGRGE